MNLLIPVRGPLLRRRFVNLVIGLVLFGAGIGLMLQSGLGVAPWDVLHQGLAERFGLTVGVWSIIVSMAILVCWLPLREPYGVGTVLNAVIIGIVIDLTVRLVPAPGGLVARIFLVAAGIVTVGFASGLYIGARLGPGPRDGLMTGIARRGRSLRLTRTVIEVSALAAGWLLGGTVGVGTIAFALLMGPLVHFFLPRLAVGMDTAARPAT